MKCIAGLTLPTHKSFLQRIKDISNELLEVTDKEHALFIITPLARYWLFAPANFVIFILRHRKS
jgi:hypothetical protein